MLGGQGLVDPLVGLAEAEGGVAAVGLGQLLLDDVGLDGHPEVVGLPGEVGRGVVVGLGGLERGVAEIAPQHREHAQLVGLVEELGDLLNLPPRFPGPEVDGGPHPHRPHVERLLDAREPDLVVGVGVGDELVVVELEDERDLVGVAARQGPEHPQGRRHRVAPALDAQPDDVLGVEVGGVGRERGAGGVLDALVDGQDRDVAGVREPPRAEQRLQARQHPRRPVREGAAAVDEVGARQVQVGGRNRPAAMLEQGRVVAEQLDDGVQPRGSAFEGSGSHARYSPLPGRRFQGGAPHAGGPHRPDRARRRLCHERPAPGMLRG